MSWRQFLGWVGYNAYEPIGPQRDDFRFGMLASVIAEPNRDRKKRVKPFSPRDFMFFTHDQGEEVGRPSGKIMDMEGFRAFKEQVKKSLTSSPGEEQG